MQCADLLCSTKVPPFGTDKPKTWLNCGTRRIAVSCGRAQRMPQPSPPPFHILALTRLSLLRNTLFLLFFFFCYPRRRQSTQGNSMLGFLECRVKVKLCMQMRTGRSRSCQPEPSLKVRSLRKHNRVAFIAYQFERDSERTAGCCLCGFIVDRP